MFDVLAVDECSGADVAAETVDAGRLEATSNDFETSKDAEALRELAKMLDRARIEMLSNFFCLCKS